MLELVILEKLSFSFFLLERQVRWGWNSYGKGWKINKQTNKYGERAEEGGRRKGDGKEG